MKLLQLWPCLVALVAIFANASTLTPHVLPLLVRNPYLSVWLPKARESPWEQWPILWYGKTVGFAVMASVPETKTVYPLLGRPHDFLEKHHHSYHVSFPRYEGATFDASTTNLTYTIDNSDVKIILSFLSPITPTSTLRQSLPAAYMTCYVEGSTDVGLFVDINGEWASGVRENEIQWDFQHTGLKTSETDNILKRWSITRRQQQLLTEFQDHAEWGTVHFSAPVGVAHQSGEIRRVIRRFAEHGSLDNAVDDAYRGIFEEEPIFAFSKLFKLGNTSTTSNESSQDSVLFTFALTQNPVVQFASARGLTMMRPLWASWFNEDSMLNYHYRDFKTAAYLAQNYSDQLAKDAYASGSQDYQDIAALSARQVLGATQFSGTPDAPIIFLKEISSNGNFQTIDVIFPAFPFFLYTNPQWLAYLLEPLLEHQMSGQYPNDYSMHDLGTHFPNATGHPDGLDEYMPVEECGDMLIMALAMVNALKEDVRPPSAQGVLPETAALESGPERWPQWMNAYGIDRTLGEVGTSGHEAAVEWASSSYKLWKQWTGYLIRESLIPQHQLSTDDFAGPLANQTNLALKGIIGIKAMSEIALLVGNDDEAEQLSSLADEYMEKWQGFGLSHDRTHAKLAYSWYGSWTTLYNMFADALLCFRVPTSNSSSTSSSLGSSRIWGSEQASLGGESTATIKTQAFLPDEVYQMQSDWYHAVVQKYGLPLDSRHLYTKSDWEFFAAAVASRQVRTEMLQHVATWVNESAADGPLTDLYDTEGRGDFPDPGLHFRARPVVGGHFAFLALERACGGKAMESLSFLDEADPREIDVEMALRADIEANQAEPGEL
ncbi:DUF1793-domain-containing protein [Xylariaceae sp. FL0804]|nr:DUF1793-domain-containing protein [Xylariaceae sp. FL0804]